MTRKTAKLSRIQIEIGGDLLNEGDRGGFQKNIPIKKTTVTPKSSVTPIRRSTFSIPSQSSVPSLPLSKPQSSPTEILNDESTNHLNILQIEEVDLYAQTLGQTRVLLDEELSEYPYCKLPDHFFERVEQGAPVHGITARLPALPSSGSVFIARAAQ